MNKKTFTVLFTLVSTVANVLLTLLTILVLLLLSTVILVRLLHQEGEVVMIAWMVCFIAGMVISMFGFARLTSLVIAKFHLEDKLEPHLLKKKAATNRGADGKPKTVLPDSVLPKEDDRDTWAEQIENSTYGASFGLNELQQGIEENNAQAQALIAEREAEARRWEAEQAARTAGAAPQTTPAPEDARAASQTDAAAEAPVSFGREELERLQKRQPSAE